jgi:hypothetical protein
VYQNHPKRLERHGKVDLRQIGSVSKAEIQKGQEKRKKGSVVLGKSESLNKV